MNKLIKLSEDHYIVVDDSEIKEENFFLHGNSIYKCHEINLKGIRTLKDGKEYYFKTGVKKITHSTEPLKGVKTIYLSEVEETINGYNVEKTAEQYVNSRFTVNPDTIFTFERLHRETFEAGFKAHQKITKDKNKEAIDLLTNITEWSSFKEHPIGKQAQKALNLLLPQTEWNCTFDENNKIKL